jgi:hypothetical protein
MQLVPLHTAMQVAVNGAIERAVTGGVRDLFDHERIGVAMVGMGFCLFLSFPRSHQPFQ